MQNESEGSGKKASVNLKNLRLTGSKFRKEIKKAVEHLWADVRNQYKKAVSKFKK